MPPRRECVPSSERDDYIASRRIEGLTEVSVRVLERYIDEFLRFCEENSGYTEAKYLTRNDIVEFAEKQKTPGILKNTARVKLISVLGWLEWLIEQKRLKKNPAADLTSTQLLQ